MDVAQDHAALLPAGDFATLDKSEQEAFSAMQEDLVQQMMKAANSFQRRFPGLKVEWRWQMDVYRDSLHSPATVRYSQRVY